MGPPSVVLHGSPRTNWGELCMITFKLHFRISKKDLISNEHRLIVLMNNGTVVKSGPQIVSHQCQINILKFPFDDQTCTFSLGSWVYTNANLRLFTPFEQYELSEDFTGNTEWKLLSLKAELTVDSTYEEGDFDVK
ncbi:hypothetical protein NECAME_11033 [Necator americanus]|uniref:Neurotransmitter-gated ion-channel ligand-binding domain-containing protein n=1 Tax=Necator americanus TaxID=51031 RepID=W2T8C5_NECAM|nr:hypothetical protein NECAME_11033 [Necator americanus]ETN77436.1 hypothetical protein NECAME_11033 [Necator americanus]